MDDKFTRPTSNRKGELAWILERAVKRDNVPLVELLLSYSSDEQKELETLFASFQVGPGPEVCKWLLARGFRRDIWDQAFARALREENIEGARLLLSTVDGIPALAEACSAVAGIWRGSYVMARDGHGTTPLHELCVASWHIRDMGPMARYQVAKLLISNGADPNAMNVLGTTPLQVACSNTQARMGLEDAKVVLALLEYGVHVDQLDSRCKSPLFIACSRFNHSVASILLEKGAERSSETLRGFADRYTKMSDDLIDGNAHEMAKLLLSHGVDRVLVRQEMMSLGSLGHELFVWETFRLLLMHADAGMDEPIFLEKDVCVFRTEALAEALGMIKEDKSDFYEFSWPIEN
ncbi:hypothetical protein MY11210_006283 [Beauveria gryllotalpidicola]